MLRNRAKTLLLCLVIILSCIVLIGVWISSSVEKDVRLLTDIKVYHGAQTESSPLSSRTWMAQALNVAKQENFAPATAARFYSYIASIYADTLAETDDTAQASIATAAIFSKLAPDYAKQTQEMLGSMDAADKELSPEAEHVVAQFLDRIDNDNYQITKKQDVPEGEDVWFVRGGQVDFGASAGSWLPWIIESPSDFHVPPPPALGSLEDRMEMEKVAYAVNLRKKDILETIYFWHGSSGFVKGQRADNITPAGVWQNILWVEEGDRLNDQEYANIQKVLSQAIADSFIASWEVKYRFWTQRPSMRIKNLDTAVADPPFPSYVSGHSTISKTAATVLSYLIPEKKSVWERNAQDAKNSRLVGGIHFNVDNEVGFYLGEQVGNAVLAKLYPDTKSALQPARYQKPTSPKLLSQLYWIRFLRLKDKLLTDGRALAKDIFGPKAKSQFTDIALEAGLKTITENESATHSSGFALAPGASWGDYNNDGWIDLFIPSLHNDEPNALYRNNKDETFTNVANEAGVAYVGHSWAGVFGDYDNDGCLDLYVSNYGHSESLDSPGEENLLYRNNCDGSFTDVTKRAGVEGKEHSAGVAWADYDKDGYLDLYVANYGLITAGGGLFEGNNLYHNNGDGTFTDVAVDLGVGDVVYPKGTRLPADPEENTRSGLAFQPVWWDFNNDGWDDLFVATDFGVSPLWQNNGNGTFTDVSEKSGVSVYGTGMGVAVGDYNRDGALDLYVTNYFENYLWHNNGDGTFTELAKEVGLNNDGVGWGTAFLDYDNDGNLDLYLTNGSEGPKWQDEVLRKQNGIDVFYVGNGKNNFTDLTTKVGVNEPDVSMGLATADFNNDGFTDVLVVHNHGDHKLYKNTGKDNNWLTLRLNGSKDNTHAVGAKVRVKTNNKWQVQQVVAGGSYLSQNTTWLNFGLGKTTKVDAIEITWPDNSKQTVGPVQPNQILTITQDKH